MEETSIRCICNQKLNSFRDYKLAILEGITEEIDIFCPNESCSIRELGYVKFFNNNGNISFSKAKFYPTFVSYNVSNTEDKTYQKLKSHLRDIVNISIDWKNLHKNMS